MQHPIAACCRHGFDTLRHAPQRHIAPAPGALRHQRHLGLRRAFQQQFRARQVICQDHFIIHGYQPITHAYACCCRRAVARDGGHHNLPALHREPKADTALPKPPFARKLGLFRGHVAAERVKMAEDGGETRPQQRIAPCLAKGR